MAEFGGSTAEIQALGMTEEEEAWSRYAFKLAIGAGKTKVMSLAIVWSYFHALQESDSDMARHFVVIAPNLTVYERLKQEEELTEEVVLESLRASLEDVNADRVSILKLILM